MSKLIAQVATAVVVNGERTVIQPGQPLPPLSDHDARALLASGAAQDPGEAEKEAKAQAREARAADAEFAQARELQLQQAQSIATDAKPAEPTEPTQPKKGAKE